MKEVKKITSNETNFSCSYDKQWGQGKKRHSEDIVFLNVKFFNDIAHRLKKSVQLAETYRI